LQVIDSRDLAAGGCNDIVRQVSVGIGFRVRALRLHDVVELLQGAARLENITRDPVALTTAHIGVELEYSPGQLQRLVFQVQRCLRIVLEYLHDVAGLEHRSDSPADRLRAVGNHHLEMQPQLVPRIFEQLA